MFELIADRKEFLAKIKKLEKGSKAKIRILLKVLKVNPVPARDFDVKKLPTLVQL